MAIERIGHLSGGTGYLADPIAPLQVKALQEAAPSQSMTLQIQDIRTADDISVAFEVGVRERAEGLLTTAESIFVAQRARVSELGARHRLPAMYPYAIQVTDAGGLMAAMAPTATPWLELTRQLRAGQIAAERAQVGICFRLKDEDAHRPPIRGGAFGNNGKIGRFGTLYINTSCGSPQKIR